ncbi:MAG: hypothetical protein E7410_01135 [Ruminococcaceae bacterium]|nr:hypothetical protein [Oscillospiraceae bacterium]
MGILFVFLHLAFGQGESMTVKEHGKRYKKGGTFFNASICFFALIYTIVSEFFAKDGLFFFPTKIWIYGIASGICYAIGFYGAYLAFKLGSFGKTKLISTFGLVLPIFYGVVFLKETTTIYTYISLALIALSVFLMNYKTLEDDTKAHNTKKWIFWIITYVLANFAISILSKHQQLTFGSVCNNEFIMISYAVATISLLILGFVCESEKLSNTFKNGFTYGILAGAFNGARNFFHIRAYMYLPLSIISPISTALGIVISFVISVVVYKEKFTFIQYISAFIGIIAAVLLNIK